MDFQDENFAEAEAALDRDEAEADSSDAEAEAALDRDEAEADSSDAEEAAVQRDEAEGGKDR